MRIRQKVFEDLAPVIGPLYRPGLPRRRSSDIDLKPIHSTMNKTDNNFINFNDSSQKIQEKPPHGSVTARIETGEGNLLKHDLNEKSAETNDKTHADDAKMIMNHDESV